MRFRLRTVWFAVFALLVAAMPVQAKVFRVNIVADPAQMDPITYSEIVSNHILHCMYEGFTDVDAKGDVVPDLAVSWEPLANGTGLRFHLRKNVKFTSGRTFTAKDVKYTLEMLLTPGMNGGLAASYLKNIVGAADLSKGKVKDLAGVKIVDDYTVDIEMLHPDALFPEYPIYFMDSGIVAEQGPNWMTKMSAGTGPFMFKQWTRGVSVDLVTNPNYWGGAPKISGVSFVIVPNATTTLSLYDAGDLDFVDVSDEAYRQVLRDSRYKSQIVEAPSSVLHYLGLNQSLYAPFKDIRVREAISLSINRQAIVKGLYFGAGLNTAGIIMPGVPGASTGLLPLQYDPAKAKQLMSEAGYPDGKGLPPVSIVSTAVNTDYITYLADQLHKTIGLPVTVQTMERASFIKSLNAGEIPFFDWSWTGDYPDAMTNLETIWTTHSPYNRSRWSNADFDKIIAQAKTENDTAKRFALYHQAEKILLDDWATVPLPAIQRLGLRKPYVQNVSVNAYWLTPLKDVVMN